ncbi:36475_t:CDS:2 [Gigaspora margarita]|uniref:36475_t:CDS:1 n=1 Tax=Gigaspora margarita TaxID=4874 RepID=A0ABN7US95_GIGMA|nr:36475_t:CDS:2 [Gigaspora margarita]
MDQSHDTGAVNKEVVERTDQKEVTSTTPFWYGSKLLMDNNYDLKMMYSVYTAIIVESTFCFPYAPDMAKSKYASGS